MGSVKSVLNFTRAQNFVQPTSMMVRNVGLEPDWVQKLNTEVQYFQNDDLLGYLLKTDRSQVAIFLSFKISGFFKETMETKEG